MNVRDAIDFVDQQVQATELAGFRDRLLWSVALLYFNGRQWARQSNIATTPNTAGVRYLNTVLDPSRPDVRVTMNIVEENTTKVHSKITPNEIPFGCIPQEGSNPEDGVLADMGETQARIYAEEKHLLSRLRYSSWKRVILGSHLVKGVMRRADTMPTGEGYERRDFDLANIDPWQLMTDPANLHPDLALCHRWVIHSYAMPTAELNARFGLALKPQGRLGDLQRERALFATVQGQNAMARAQESRMDGNVVHELYWGDQPGRYDEFYMIARDDQNKGIALWPSDPKQTGNNPWPGLPFLKLDYHWRTDSCWGKGVPLLNLNAQDIHNLSLTTMLRYLVHASWVCWVTPKECMTPELRKQMQSNQMMRILEYTPSITGSLKPEMARPPEMSPTAGEFVGIMPAAARRQAGLEDVNFGQISKRGEPAGTVRARIEQADTVHAEVSNNDAERIKQFIMTMLGFSIVNRDYMSVAERVGDRFSDDQIYRWLNMNPRRPSLKIFLVPGALMPKTPQEYKAEHIGWLQSGVITPMEMRMYLYMKTGVALSPVDEAAFRLATEENRRMLGGEAVEVWPHDMHPAHIPMHELCYNEAVTRFRYGPDAMDRLSAHVVAHKEAQGVEMMATNPEAAPGTGTGSEVSPAVSNAMAGMALGGRSPNALNQARSEGASAEQLVA